MRPTNQTAQLDPKTLRMLEKFADRRFQSTQDNQRLRLVMSWWVVRNKIVGNLKRVLDITVSVVAIILGSPIMLATALAIKLDSPGPILFCQTRVGKYGEHFACYKFRSMYIDAETRKAELMARNEADGPVFKIKHDPRVTRVGRIIRKLSIDELPQLFNVLRGEMSLVGPRPALPSEVAKYNYEQIGRLHAIPGITGLQQVSGRSDVDFKRWVELDLQYISEQSIWKDLEILVRTIPAVLFSKGAY
ncbi:exopolysaccharide biosynthesis polyprenyl glycosylphosphotransferase [Candidatus Oscillochloris fontis]|uniref:exopolysaccharide biosynthesis polyprenyl glycosylphosphotransferase n=1 Tax=Candidatus Oscillochloris fontis TaxID=2496868 RepID=UPI00101BB2A0|nr:exopolysaccharide biosynthesis polyprenyl glycosylphosphotransferase [Candidatus Oscillochloris fontis]